MRNQSFLEIIRPSVIERIREIPANITPQKNTIDFCNIFRRKIKPALITEIKFSSPSQGILYRGKDDPTDIAQQYLSSGSHALSVLTEPNFFNGKIDSIATIRATIPMVPILMKDFILDRKQITQGCFYGANAVLLIASFLNMNILNDLYNYAIELGMTPIIEVHNKAELDEILCLNPKVIGINNRNLNTLEINLNTSEQLIKFIPKQSYVICESGIDRADQIRRLFKIGFDGFLIGSSLMKHRSPGIALENIVKELSHEY